MSFELARHGDIVRITVRHPSGRGSRGLDIRASFFADDAHLTAALNTLNKNIERWPVPQITIEGVRAYG